MSCRSASFSGPCPAICRASTVDPEQRLSHCRGGLASNAINKENTPAAEFRVGRHTVAACSSLVALEGLPRERGAQTMQLAGLVHARFLVAAFSKAVSTHLDISSSTGWLLDFLFSSLAWAQLHLLAITLTVLSDFDLLFSFHGPEFLPVQSLMLLALVCPAIAGILEYCYVQPSLAGLRCLKQRKQMCQQHAYMPDLFILVMLCRVGHSLPKIGLVSCGPISQPVTQE